MEDCDFSTPANLSASKLSTGATIGTESLNWLDEVPATFLYGKPETEADVARRNSKVHITQSLAYSLMLFGLGLIVTLIYLLIA